MSFRLSRRSIDTLDGVHPSMVRVVKRAIQLTSVDFTVVQGRRTLDQQMRLYGKGRTAQMCKAAGVPVHYARPFERIVTKTLRSNHLPKSDGYGRAVDLYPFVNGAIYMPHKPTREDEALFRAIARAMKAAAAELNVNIEWGGDWQSFVDLPHFEMEG